VSTGGHKSHGMKSGVYVHYLQQLDWRYVMSHQVKVTHQLYVINYIMRKLFLN